MPVSRSTPRPVRLAIASCLTAIAAGAVEALVRLDLPDPPTGGELVLRFTVWMGLALLVLALLTRRPAVRLLLTVLLGGPGLFSLLVEPATWLSAGGSVTAFLTAADAPTVLVVVLRGVHVGAVLVALVALYQPDANTFFRPRVPA